MAPVADLITSAQGGKHPGTPSVILKIVALRATILNSEEPLEIIDPAIKPAGIQQCIAPCNLHPVTQETRRKLFHAIDVRFLQRYSSMTDRSPMLDCCAFLYPPFSKLPYVNFILSTNVPSSDACTVEYVRTTTEKEIMKQALAHLKAKQQEGNASSTAAILAGASGVGKFSKDRAGACHLVDTSLSLLFGPQSEPESAVDAHIPPHIAIMQEIQRYKAEDINVSQCCPEESDVLKYWRLKKAEYPTLAIIARAFLGFAVSAAGIERDFCSAGSTITVRRNSLDNAIARQ